MSATKRLVAVLNWRNGQLVKSYSFATWRPTLSLEAALRVLDRWQVDEIILTDISQFGAPDVRLFEKLSAIRTSTPLALGGGIRSMEHVRAALDAGADRIVLESLLLDDWPVVSEIVEQIGRQAIIGSLSVIKNDSYLSTWRNDALGERDAAIIAKEWFARGLVSEVMIKDVKAEGHWGKFDFGLASVFSKLPDLSVVWFGGLDGDTAARLANLELTSGVAFGNPLLHSELAAVKLRSRVRKRQPDYFRRWIPG